MKKLCKSKTKNGQNCDKKSVISGYCIMHYTMNQKNEKKQ